MAGKENVVQGAIVAAMEVYCDRNGIGTNIFAPYSNQQGSNLSQYCSDLIAKLDGCRVILLEVKELDDKLGAGVLRQYDVVQHLDDWDLEDLGLPIQYAYARVKELSYLGDPREKQWPNSTLHSVRLCKPSELFASDFHRERKQPNTDSHHSLLDWMLRKASETSESGDVLALLLVLEPAELRNKVVVCASVLSGSIQVTALPALVARSLLLDPSAALDRSAIVDAGSIFDELKIAQSKITTELKAQIAKRGALTGDDKEEARRKARDKARLRVDSRIKQRAGNQPQNPESKPLPNRP